ncbi:MarR family transcriptional regulator [Qaidamihabitans albus]|uniref:MarR family transcriptional regulator n=1 Tax=Qaidamihabitans albus TaxID=2795733 RepID=UPI0018F1C579|nr:MarR family transcriptional regulator [Qaidamihabitans albus]
MHDPRLANLLGATALALTDLMLAEATSVAGTSGSGAAALVVLDHERGLGVTELGRRVGLSQSAAARMVDSLEQRGLVERRSARGREVSVHPTADGRRVTRQLLAARGGPLAAVVDGLSAADRKALAALLGKLLTRVHGEIGSAEHICRLCDRAACVDAGASCPVGQADRDRVRRIGGAADG